MDRARQKRKDDIQRALAFIQSSLPYTDPGSFEGFLTQLVCDLMEEGNLSFREGSWVQAIKDYSEGLNVAKYAQTEDLEVPSALFESLYVNRASTYYSKGEFELGVQDCDSALAVCESSRRALYRKAMCLKELGRYREAYNCSNGCLLVAPNDQQVNVLARELANRLGLNVRKPYVGSEREAATGSESNGKTATHMGKMSDNGLDSSSDITPIFSDVAQTATAPFSAGSFPFTSGSMSPAQPVDRPGQHPHRQHLPVPGPEPLGDFDVIGDDLDSLLDCFPKEPEATPTHLQASFPVDPPKPASSPAQSLFPSSLPALAPQLPPAFFTSVVSKLNSLDTFCPPGVGGKPKMAPRTLDPLNGSNGLDALDSFPGHGGGGGDVPKLSLNALDGLDSLNTLDSLDLLPSSGAEAAPKTAAVDGLDDLDLDDLDFLDDLDTIPIGGDAHNKALYPLDSLDSLDALDTFSPLEGATAPILKCKPVAVGTGGLGPLSNFTPPGGGRSLSAPPAPRLARSSHAMGPGGRVLSQLYQNPLASTHMFLQACSTCCSHAGPGVCDYHHQPHLAHSCERSVLLCRVRAASDPTWTRVRPRPTKVQFCGKYVVCRDLQQESCTKFGDACTFAFCQMEIDIWTLERNGSLNRDLLFDTQHASHGPAPSVARLLQLHNGMFMFLCEECYDSKPRIISKRNKEDMATCSNLSDRHPFENNKCLVHVVRSTIVSYNKIRPLQALCQYDVCYHAIRYGCQREDRCHFAHSVIELKCWMLQRDSGITHEEIVQESTKHCQEQDAHKKKANKPVNVPQPRAAAAAGGRGGSGRGLNMRMKFVCAQCWSGGLLTDPDKALKYCAAKARHSWTKERAVLLVLSPERKKWVMVRPLPHAKNYPLHYDICGHIAKQRKCTYIGNCTFAHSQEEKEVWTYMKNHNLREKQQMYDMWLSLTSQDRRPEGALPTQPAHYPEEKYIAMPTDLAEPMEDGLYCRLCGRHSNSERQWQDHISTEKHKGRVFSCEGEDESLAWAYRFPGHCFALCPRLESGCLEGVSCDFAHSEAELLEWKERREFMRRKLAKAREDMLIRPEDSDFGNYNFLLQD